MFIAVYEDAKKDLQAWIYYNTESFIQDTFSPACNILAVLELAISGKTYNERKEDAITKAIEFNNITCDYSINWSYSELATIQTYFENIGRHYGLLKEFKENCII